MTQTFKASGRHADHWFWAAAIFTLFWALGTRALWGAEGRWAEVAREMMLTGDFFHPAITGRPYFDKPLFGYWLILLAAPLTGLTEWAVRLPSAFCALAALWATRRLGAMLWSPTAGRLAGWMLLTAQGFLFWGRTGMADMANLAFIILAITWYWQRRAQPNFTTYAGFYLLLFVGAQMKGLTAIIVPALAVIPDLLRDKRWRNLFSIAHFAALLIGALVYLAPFIYASITSLNYSSDGIALVLRENIQRFFDPFDHVEPFYIYLKHAPTLFLPWALLLPAAVAAAARARRDCSWHDRWLLTAMGLIFLFFTASGSRRSYYILPILPLCAIFCANWLLSSAPAVWRRMTQTQIWLLGIMTGIAAAAAAALPLYFKHIASPVPPDMIWMAAAGGAALLIAWLPLVIPPCRRERHMGLPAAAAALVLSVSILMAGYFCVLQPLLDRYRTEKEFALRVKDSGRTAGQIAFFEYYLENSVFYMDMAPPDHPVINDAGAAYAYLRDAPNRVVILRRRDLPRLLAAFPPDDQGHAALEETAFKWQSARKTARKLAAWTLRP